MYDEVSDLAYFRTLVTDTQNIPLLETAASLAQDEYPGLDLEQVLSDFDILAERLAERCRDASTELSQLQTTATFFYKELGFTGNLNNYYDPNNSFVHKVLDSRRGIPISLAVLFIELARGAGLDAQGVSFPGHFLVRVEMHEGTVMIDPFTGRSLSHEDIQERLDPFIISLHQAGQSDAPTDQFLKTASAREILMRMLRNLHEIYQQQDEPDRVKRISERMQILSEAT